MISQDGQVSEQIATMLVDMDSIFDTRLGTIAKFGFDAYRDAQLAGYYTRSSDHFHGIPDKEYEDLWNKRDTTTLSMAGITHVMSILRDFAVRVNTAALTSPIQKVPRIDVNMYPYNVSEATQKLIESAMRVLIKERCDIGFVSYSPDDLHYDLVKFTYDHMVMYHIGAWINAQAEDWEKRNRAHSELTVFCPILAHSRDKSQIPDDVAGLADEFEMHMAPLVNIIHMPVMIFSQIASPFTKNYTNDVSEAEAPETQEGRSESGDTSAP